MSVICATSRFKGGAGLVFSEESALRNNKIKLFLQTLNGTAPKQPKRDIDTLAEGRKQGRKEERNRKEAKKEGRNERKQTSKQERKKESKRASKQERRGRKQEGRCLSLFL